MLDLLGREKTVGMFEVFLAKFPRNSQEIQRGI